jgi:nucleoside-diphosphate-sugar epimerase
MFPMAEPVAAACRRTKAILQAIHRYEARLAYVSSFTALPRRERGLVALEAQWRRSIHPYFEVKRRIEDMLLGAANGLDITVINPTVCMGPWDGKPRQYCFLPQLVEGKVWATTNHMINVIDVRDVAKLLWRALVGQHRGVPIPVSGHNLSVRELAKGPGRWFGLRRWRLWPANLRCFLPSAPCWSATASPGNPPGSSNSWVSRSDRWRPLSTMPWLGIGRAEASDAVVKICVILIGLSLLIENLVIA